MAVLTDVRLVILVFLLVVISFHMLVLSVLPVLMCIVTGCYLLQSATAGMTC